MSGGSERTVVVLSALVLAGLAGVWVGGWAVREARDVDPTALALVLACLQNQRGLTVSSPARDPLAAAAPRGSLTTTIEGNTVTVSLWNDAGAAEEAVGTYARLTPEDVTQRAIARADSAFLWAMPPTGSQAPAVYGCMP
ncbi:MAG: hypothetical protein H0W16_01840 [Actinobacteria bacterium]|nr:hypothetical protein [Actinomycetota bacterium]